MLVGSLMVYETKIETRMQRGWTIEVSPLIFVGKFVFSFAWGFNTLPELLLVRFKLKRVQVITEKIKD